MATNPHEAVARCTEARVVPCGSVGLWGTIEFSSSITSGVSVYKDLLGCIRKFINLYTVNVFQRTSTKPPKTTQLAGNSLQGRHRNLVDGPMLMILRKLCSPSRPPSPLQRSHDLLTSFCTLRKTPQLPPPRQILSATRENWGTHLKLYTGVFQRQRRTPPHRDTMPEKAFLERWAHGEPWPLTHSGTCTLLHSTCLWFYGMNHFNSSLTTCSFIHSNLTPNLAACQTHSVK